MNPTYQVKYSYYRHNDGRANNGQFTDSREYVSLDEANCAARRIQAVIEGVASEAESEAVFDEFHPYSGHFSWVKVYEVTRKELPVPCPVQA